MALREAGSYLPTIFAVTVPFRKRLRLVCLLALCAAGLSLLVSCQHARVGAASRKLIILGIDGLDPDLLTKFMAEGKMPNFARLAQQGSFRRLTTSIPPQSPVAWADLVPGRGPAHEVQGEGQEADLRPTGSARFVPAFDDEHPAAKPGGVVEPDHGNECRRARHF